MIKIRSKDNKVIDFKHKVTEFSTLLRTLQEENESEEIGLQFEASHIELLRKYLQVVNYKLPNYKIP